MNWKATAPTSTSIKDFLAEDINEDASITETLTPQQSKETVVNIIEQQLNGTTAQDIVDAVKPKRAVKPKAVKPTSDPINPDHYKVGGVETIDFIEAKGLNYNLGNVVKYTTRADHKGNRLEDLKKARWYLNREISKLDNSEC